MLRNPWFRAGLQAWSLGLEASSVIALRTLKMATGGVAADVEARRMVSEKIEAGFAIQVLALTGGLGLTPTAPLPERWRTTDAKCVRTGAGSGSRRCGGE